MIGAAKTNLFGMTLVELTQTVSELGMRSFAGRQIAEWMYRKHATSIDAMTNISKADRALLSENFEIRTPSPVTVRQSKDGTRKYLFETEGGKFIETAVIPDKDRVTVCVSSQVGCKMGCLFCITARQGFQGQLSAGAIVNQLRSIEEREAVTNIVYMGMGEPLDNLTEVLKSIEILNADWGYAMGPKRITVSTVGILPAMKTYLENSKCHLAVSLHTPFAEERRRLMPVTHVYAVDDILNEIRSFDFGLQRKLTFEYILFEGLNDTPRHVKEMARLVGGLRCRVNLIRYHAAPDSPLRGCTEEKMQAFRDALNKKGILATVRASRGEDILAACGMLSTKAYVHRAEPDY